MNDYRDVAFQLLRVALGNVDHVEYDPVLVDWQRVLELASRQGVAGVCFEAFSRLPESVRPNDKLFIKWLGHTLLLEDRYNLYREVITRLSDVARGLDMRALVLKGYGCSLNYPQPKHRPCGDIDIFLLDDNGSHSDRLMQRLEIYLEKKYGINVNYPNGHHSQFMFGGFLVENHSTVLDVDAHKSSVYLNGLLDTLAAAAEPTIIGNSEIWLPSVKFNSIHLLRHMASDFASVRTTLRNVLDWSSFVTMNTVDWTFVREVARRANMHRFLDAVNAICVTQFGYPSNIFPIEDIDEKLTKRVLDEILNGTDALVFPSDEGSLWNRVTYALLKTRRMWKNRWKYSLVYDESLFESFLWKARYRMKNRDDKNRFVNNV